MCLLLISSQKHKKIFQIRVLLHSLGYYLDKTQRLLERVMSILEILEFPDPRLRKIALPIKEVTDKLRAIIDEC